MARRRYISTDISIDPDVTQLVEEYGEFAGLLYTWMIPHAEDDATLSGDPRKLLYQVVPGLRSRTVADVEAALEGMARLGLIEWDRAENLIRFPAESFYRYQTYIKEDRRRSSPQNSANQRKSAQNAEQPREAAQDAEEQRETPQNTASHSFSHSHTFTPTTSANADGEPRAEGAPSSPPVLSIVPSPAEKVDKPFDLFVALCEELGADPSQVAPAEKSRQLAHAKWLLEQGFGEQKVRACLRYLKSQTWRTSPIDLKTVVSEIGKWEMNGCPETAEPRASPRRAQPKRDPNAGLREFSQRMNELEGRRAAQDL